MTGFFLCPSCLVPGLTIRSSIQLPADGRSDEISLQIVGCEHCPFQAAAVYEESRRGSIHSESWEHTGYYVDLTSLKELGEVIARCPKPATTDCSCVAHSQRARKNERGRWLFPDGFDRKHSFTMRLIR